MSDRQTGPPGMAHPVFFVCTARLVRKGYRPMSPPNVCLHCLTANEENDSIANRTVVQVSGRLGKLLRRLQVLKPGRQELLLTVDDQGNIVDWSIRQWGVWKSK